MEEKKKFPTSEIKALLKLAKKYGEIELNDTPYVKEIKSLLKDIAFALETNNVNRMSYYSHLIVRRYGHILITNPKVLFCEAIIETMDGREAYWLSQQLKLFAEGLIDEIKACKERERNAAINGVVGGYVCEKVITALMSHRLNLFFSNYNPYPQKL